MIGRFYYDLLFLLGCGDIFTMLQRHFFIDQVPTVDVLAVQLIGQSEFAHKNQQEHTEVAEEHDTASNFFLNPSSNYI